MTNENIHYGSGTHAKKTWTLFGGVKFHLIVHRPEKTEIKICICVPNVCINKHFQKWCIHRCEYDELIMENDKNVNKLFNNRRPKKNIIILMKQRQRERTHNKMIMLQRISDQIDGVINGAGYFPAANLIER